MSKRIKYFLVLISLGLALILDICVCRYEIAKLDNKISEIEKYEEIPRLAQKYMNTKYNLYWFLVDGMSSGGKPNNTDLYVYEVATWERKGEEKCHIRYGITKENRESEEQRIAIGCEKTIGSAGVTIWSQYFGKPSEIDMITGSVDVYNEEYGYWEEQGFVLEYVEDQYILQQYWEEAIGKDEELEEKTGMTIEQITEIAVEEQVRLEKMVLKVRGRDKIFVLMTSLVKLLLLNGIFIAVFLYFVWKARINNRGIDVKDKELMDENKNRNKSTIKK